MGLFKPAWMSDKIWSDRARKKGIAAVDKAQVSELRQIAFEAPIEEVAARACERLAEAGNVDALFEVATNPAGAIRAEAALKSIDNSSGTYDERLKDLAKNGKFKTVRRESAQRIHDPALLLELARSIADSDGLEQSALAGIAANPATPVEALAQIAQKKDGYLDDIVCENPQCTPELMETIKASKKLTKLESYYKKAHDYEASSESRAKNKALLNNEINDLTVSESLTFARNTWSLGLTRQLWSRILPSFSHEDFLAFALDTEYPEIGKLAWEELKDSASEEELRTLATVSEGEDPGTIASFRVEAGKKLLSMLSSEELERCAEDPTCIVQRDACERLGHVYRKGDHCVCHRCGASLGHTIKNGVCTRCGGKAEVLTETEVDYWYDTDDGQFKSTETTYERTYLHYPDGSQEMIKEVTKSSSTSLR